MSYFQAKCTRFDFGWGSAPDPAGGAHSAPPDRLTGSEGVLLLRERKAKEGREKGNGVSRLLGDGRPCINVEHSGRQQLLITNIYIQQITDDGEHILKRKIEECKWKEGELLITAVW